MTLQNYYSRTTNRDMERIRHSIEREKAKMQSTIRWKLASKEWPDDATIVLIALDDDSVWLGYTDAHCWCYVDGQLVSSDNLKVTHWASMPTPPHI